MRWMLVALTACWIGPAAPASAPIQNVARTPHPRTDRSIWIGHYTCPQGDTAVRLTIATAPTGEARARFEFGPLPENPSVPTGSYSLRGIVRSDPSGAFDVELSPERWIEQPPGYVMVGLTAVSDARREHLVGKIAQPSCGEIDVTRSDDDLR